MLSVDHDHISLVDLLRLTETCHRRVECQSSETINNSEALKPVLNQHNTLNETNTITT